MAPPFTRSPWSRIFLKENSPNRTCSFEPSTSGLPTKSWKPSPTPSPTTCAPLRAINGFSRIVLEECRSKMDPTHQRHLRRVCDGAQQMGQLVDDLLSFSRYSRQPLKK